jgi:hypothetical protein
MRKKYGNRPDLRHHTVKGARVILKLPSRKATHLVPPLDEMVREGGDNSDNESLSDVNGPLTSTVLNMSSPQGSPGLIDWEGDDNPTETLASNLDEDCHEAVFLETHGIMQGGHKKVGRSSPSVVTSY